MRLLIHIAIWFLPLSAFSQSYYLKGQVKDEAGNGVQNAGIYMHSTGYVYYSGLGGAFGITTRSRMDTVTFSAEGYISQKLVTDATHYLSVQLKKASAAKSSHGYKLSSLTQNLKREEQQQWFTGDETYASIIENGFVDAARFSTTSLNLNVDRASYSNVRRFLNMNSTVPPDAVRIEEMLNYFNFNYNEPPPEKVFQINATLTQCAWNKNNQLLLAQITSKKLPLHNLPATQLVFLIDVSGSMDMPNRLPLLKSGFKALVNNLREIDTVSIVVYGGTVGVALPATGGNNKEAIFKAIDSLQAGGATPGASGINLAYSMARRHFIKGGNNRIILATDGDFNVGLKKEEELEELIMRQRQQGIYLTCLGIGMGNYKDSKIQMLAQRGNGNFAYLDSYAEAEKVLLKEFTKTLYTVADNASLHVVFDPASVKAYRLIGFDNKVGAVKDTAAVIEGGEIGSAYAALVAFEIEPVNPSTTGKKPEVPASFTLQFKLPGDSSWCRITEAPQVPLTAFEALPKCYQFASAVIMFGSMLRNSKFLKDASWNSILQIATNAADINNFSQKEFLSIVQQAKNIYSKKRR